MKQKYHLRNWSEYDRGLKQRGSLTFWLSEEVLSNWILTEKSGTRGADNYFSDQAILTFVMVKSLFSLAGRQTEGFLESLFVLMGIDLPMPDHTTVSRRAKNLDVVLPVNKRDEPRHVVVDSTGVKVYGEGEWKTRQHGVSKRRTWRKLHLAVDEKTGKILVAEVTTNNCHDGDVLESLLEAVEGEIEQVSGDGAYDRAAPELRSDQRKCYRAIAKRGAMATILPQNNAQKWSDIDGDRNRNIEKIEEIGRKEWKEESGYNRRSISETTMFRLKTIFGGKLSSRDFDNQAVELFVKCLLLNKMIQIAKPDSYIV
ncbi:IS5 family transposase [Geminocystis sp. NIES-3709]|uniref:IS5 family transposase n=1 Tax=Geminocystis sp. NIES-3709 TaxID=1617448 RepID=UPI0005FCC221|nr:IS5 family transposase [Geminocystis sp. NIES-3709]BAQ63252.1 mobile element protein [Geminocystis sp. NIES-3709]